MLNGILNVYKEPGFTSNDVVAKLRGILHQKKIGHAGTLDPAAQGVLPILLGCATRLSGYVMDHDKTYRAVLLLGVVTDTQDMTGTVLSRCMNELPAEAALREAALSFIGTCEQLPPMYSAKQVNGKRLYELARQGREVERKRVPVTIKDLQIERIELPEMTFSVSCSKGTYIRTLCHDIGQKLGCGGCMKQLTRTSCGGFEAEDAVTLGEIEALTAKGRIQDYVIPCEELFPDCLKVRMVSEAAQKKLLNGNALTLHELSLPPEGAGELIRMYDRDGSFLAVYRFEKEKSRYVPFRMLITKQTAGCV